MEIQTLQDIPEQEKFISQSCIACGKRCEMKMFLRYRLGIKPKVAEFKKAPRLGDIFHLLMKYGPEGIETVRASVRADQDALMKRVSAGEDLTGELARTCQGLTELFNKALVMAQIFWTKFPQPANLKTLAREIKIVMPPDANCKYPRRGKIDLLQVDENDRSVWVRDSKTTSRDTMFTLSGCGWSIQSRFYRMLTSHYIKEMIDVSKIMGFIYDVAQVPGIKMCGKDEKGAKEENITSFEFYMKRVKTWYADKGIEAMSSKAIVFNEPMMPAELQRAIDRIVELFDRPLDPANFDRDVTMDSCKCYNRTCDYMKLCESSPAGWPSIINALYMIQVPDSYGEEETEASAEGETNE